MTLVGVVRQFIKQTLTEFYNKMPWRLGSGDNSIDLNKQNQALGICSVAEGYQTTASGQYSHAEGQNTTASGQSSHAEGEGTTASGYISHAEGENTTASGESSHAEGCSSSSISDADVSTQEELIYLWENDELFSLAYGLASHVEGYDCLAFGEASHAEGNENIVRGDQCHAEGNRNYSNGTASHVEGGNNTTSNDYEHAEGRYNKSNTGTRHSVGIGTSSNNKKNAFEIMSDGKAYLYGIGGYDGTNPQSTNTLQQIIHYNLILDISEVTGAFYGIDHKIIQELIRNKEWHKIQISYSPQELTDTVQYFFPKYVNEIIHGSDTDTEVYLYYTINNTNYELTLYGEDGIQTTAFAIQIYSDYAV